MEEIQNKLEVGEPLTPAQLNAIPLFAGISAAQLEKNPGAYVLRRFKKGEVVCREGDQGSTAFYIVKGTVSALIRSPLSHVTTKSKSSSWLGIKGFFGKMASTLASDAKSAAPAYIPIDAPVDLSYDKPVATLKEGDLFGEMTCLNRYPRSATVIADGDCEIVEMLRNILQMGLKNPDFKARLDAAYRERALETHLRGIPLFASVSDDFLKYLKEKVELVSAEQGKVIFSEGDDADALYLVRLGFVKVTKKMPGGEMVLAYLSRGSYFGEMGLMAPFMQGAQDAVGKRGATCVAVDTVELVKIKADDFKIMVQRFAEVAKSIQETIQSRETMNKTLLSVPQNTSLGDFLDQGLFQAQNLLVLDLNKCTRCDACSQACASTHDGVTRLIREGLRYENYLVATSCRQCNNPLCMMGCPVGSIRRKETLEITIEDWCIGCGMCSKSCPYGNINMHSFEVKEPDPVNPAIMKAVPKKKATTCDLCTDLKEPSCVYACPHDAAHRVNPKEFFG